MKTQINEIKRMQYLAGILIEAPISTGIGTVDSSLFPQKLSQVDIGAARSAVQAGKKDGNEKDDSAIASKIQTKFSSPVSELYPAQTEVIPEKAVSIALGMLNSGKIGGNLGAIISGDNHIMDGHHRWAATTLVNPNASVEGIKIDVPGDALVGILNVYTKGELNRTKGNPGEGNVNEFTPEKISSVLDSLITKGTKIGIVGDDGSYSEKPISGEEIKKLLGKMPGANGDFEKGKQLMAANADKLNKKIPDWAPPRVDMPVINSNELDGLINKLKSGEFDIVEPYSAQLKTAVSAKAGSLPQKEPTKESQTMNRLQQLAGLQKEAPNAPAAPAAPAANAQPEKVQGSINLKLFQSLNIPDFNPSSFSTTIGKVKSGGALNMNDNKILANTMAALIKTSDDALLGKIFANLKQMEAK